MNIKKVNQRRSDRFNGVLNSSLSTGITRDERNKNSKRLKAYLRGSVVYRFGFEKVDHQLIPMEFLTQSDNRYHSKNNTPPTRRQRRQYGLTVN